MISEQTLYIGLCLLGQSEPTPAAIMKLQRQNNVESGSLAYGLGYLAKPEAIALQPDGLPLRKEVFTLASNLIRDGGALPLAIRDALPDAWGRQVITHELNGRIPNDSELLLLTNDERCGAMVFSSKQTMPTSQLPQSYSVEELADACARLQYDLPISKSLQRILHQGSSLGGARPKASFMYDDALWLAKFGAKGDPVDVQSLEFIAGVLADACGIQLPKQALAYAGKNGMALLSKRFDRSGSLAQLQRWHYLSAAALLDIPYESSRGSYVQLAQALRRLSAAPKYDLQQLFRRMIFNLAIDNSDDHIKNHGVLYVGEGQYRLAPAFDLVPQLSNLGYQSLSIDGENHNSELDRARRAAPHFGLSFNDADRIIDEILTQVYLAWPDHFAKYAIDAALCKRVDSCFKRQAKVIGSPQGYQ